MTAYLHHRLSVADAAAHRADHEGVGARSAGVDRKIRVRGTIHAGERLTAECEGLFISMQPGVFKQLLNDRAELDDA